MISPCIYGSSSWSPLFLTLVILGGCAHELPVRTQHSQLQPLDPATRSTQLALTEVVILPQKTLNVKKNLPVLFSDEQFMSDGESWTFSPSARIIQADAMLSSIFYLAGVGVKTYPSLQAAKMAGAHSALIIVQNQAIVNFPDSRPVWWSPHNGLGFWGEVPSINARATVDLSLFFVNLDAFRIDWTDNIRGTFTGELTLPHPLYYPAEFTADVATGDIEPQIHPFRVLLIHAYYEASKAVLELLDRHVKGDLQ